MKWILKDTNLQQLHHFKKLIKNIYIKKVSMHFTNKFFISWFIFLFLFFDTTLTHFLSQHFLFFMCDRHNVVISKVHYESIIVLGFTPNFLWWFLLKFMTTWIIKKLIMLILNMALSFTFVCNLEKLQVWHSKLSTYSCFHP